MSKKTKKAVAGPPIRLRIKAGEATQGPPIGSTLAPKGVKVMDFCKLFNEKTKVFEKGAPIPVRVIVYKDKTFDVIIKKPTARYFLLRAANVNSGSSMPNKNKVGFVMRKQLESIVEEKMSDLNAGSMEAAIRTLSGTAQSMGIEVRGDEQSV